MTYIAVPVQAQALHFVVWLLSFLHSTSLSQSLLARNTNPKLKKILITLIVLLASLPTHLNWVSFCTFHIKPVTNTELDLNCLIKLWLCMPFMKLILLKNMLNFKDNNCPFSVHSSSQSRLYSSGKYAPQFEVTHLFLNAPCFILVLILWILDFYQTAFWIPPLSY